MTVIEQRTYGVPEGRYKLTLTGYEEAEFANKSGVHPFFLQFTAEALDDEGESGEFRELASPSLGKKARLRFLAEGLLGRELEAGEPVDLDKLVGRSRNAFVAVNDRGYNQILNWAKAQPAGKAAPRTFNEVFGDQGTTNPGDLPF